MSLRNILLLLVAITAAGLTAFYANNWLNAERAAMRAVVPVEQKIQPTLQILVADKELTAGKFVRADHLKWQPWPEDALNDEYVIDTEHKIAEYVGSVVRNRIAPGQPITSSLLVHPGDRGFLAAVLIPGARAVSVPVNATSGISGFIFPGDKVDLLLTSRFSMASADGQDREARYVTNTVLNGIRVLAIDQKTESKDGEINPAKTVTLEVTPKQAEKVAVSMAMGTLSLSLHSLALLGNGDQQAGVAMVDHATSSEATSGPLKLGNVTAQMTKRGHYTLDSEVNSLVGKKIRKRTSARRKVTVLRGDKKAK